MNRLSVLICAVMCAILYGFFAMPANANTAPCPVFGAEPLLPGEVIMGRVEACIQARKNGSTTQIKDFVCPA